MSEFKIWTKSLYLYTILLDWTISDIQIIQIFTSTKYMSHGVEVARVDGSVVNLTKVTRTKRPEPQIKPEST